MSDNFNMSSVPRTNPEFKDLYLFHGKSAYQAAVEHGFIGTEEEWVEVSRSLLFGSIDTFNKKNPNIIYIDLNTDYIYRYDDVNDKYIPIGGVIGETENSAFRGDLGKIAYDHSQSEHVALDHHHNAEEIDDFDNQRLDIKVVDVLTGSNLNDITTPNLYRGNFVSDIVNAPIDNSTRFKLEVYDGGSDTRIQVYMGEDNLSYYRVIQLVDGVYNTTLLNWRLSGAIYVHPDTHPANMIQEDSTHRFVTDEEKETWNSTEGNANKYTDEKISVLIGNSPDNLNTLDKISASIGDDSNFANTVTDLISSNLDNAKKYSDNNLKTGKDYTDSSIDGLLDGVSEDLNTLNKLASSIGNDSNFATTIRSEISSSESTVKAYTDQTVQSGMNTSLASAKEYADQIGNTMLNTAKEFTNKEVSALVNSAPDLLNTLDELANALGNDPNFATTVMTKIGENSTGIEDIKSGAVSVGKAIKLATARNISLTGSVTGSGTFDGSGDLSINTTTHIADIPFVMGTQTSKTNSWTGVLNNISSLYDGLTIRYWLPFNVSNTNVGVTLDLTLSDGSTTGALYCYHDGNYRLKGHYTNGNIITLTYRENVSVGGSGDYTGWWANASYNTDTYDRLLYLAYPVASTAIKASSLIVGSEGVGYSLQSGLPFDITYPILFNLSSGTEGKLIYETFSTYRIMLPANIQKITLVPHKPVFIKGTLNGNMLTPISTEPLTQDIPTTEDGYQYLYLGDARSSAELLLVSSHPIFEFRNGVFGQMTNSSVAATKLTSSAGSSTKPVYFSDGVPVTIDYDIQANIERFYGSLASGGWKTLGGRSTGHKISVFNSNNSPASWNTGNYTSGLLFGTSDVKGFLECSYNNPTVSFGGGSVNNSTDDAPNWYFKLAGTSEQIYTFPSSSGTLALSNHTHSSLIGKHGGDSANNLTEEPTTGGLLYKYLVFSSTSGIFPTTNNANSIITLNRHTGNYNSQLGFSNNGYIYYRSFSNAALDTTTAWKQLAFDGECSAAKATKDSAGQQINTTYIKGLSISNNIITYTKGDGTTDTIPLPASTYTLPVAGTTLGGIKSGGDITVASDGTVSVKDDSHNHKVMTVSDLRGAAFAPTDMYQKSLATFFRDTDMPSSAWWSGITVAGWSTDYNQWQLAGYSHNDDANKSLYYRNGRSSTWQAWREILDSSNYSSYALPLSGGNLTGALISNSLIRTTNVIFGYRYIESSNLPAFVLDKPGPNYSGIGGNGDGDTIYFGAVNTSGLTWNYDYKQKWKFNGDVIAIDGVKGNYNGTDYYIGYPGGGQFRAQSASYTGLLKITLPVSWTNTMIKFKVSIFNYDNGASIDYIIAGYNYSGDGKWYSVTAYCIAPWNRSLSNLPVSFGHDGTKCAITIGTTSTAWSYPQVTISDLTIGHSGDFNSWKSGWSIGFVSAVLSTIFSTITNTNISYDIYTELKNSVSDGKTLVANAITAKGVSTATTATFATMATNISNISTAAFNYATAITSFSASNYSVSPNVNLSWTLPTDANRCGVRIMYSTSSAPTSASSGTLVYDSNSYTGTTTTSCTFTTALANTTYYLTIFTYTYVNNTRYYTKGASISFKSVAQMFYKYTSSGTFTVPSGVTKIRVWIVNGGYCGGPGGSNGDMYSSNYGGGDGGRGGLYKDVTLSVSGGTSYTVTIGAGGSSIGSSNKSYFGSYYGDTSTGVGTGGSGGSAYYSYFTGASSTNAKSGGNGVYAFNDSTWSTTYDNGIRYCAGGGGGGARNYANPNSSGIIATPSTGGTTGGGAGGAYNSKGSDATANTGSGGGGNGNDGGTLYSGGKGGSGCVIVRVIS